MAKPILPSSFEKVKKLKPFNILLGLLIVFLPSLYLGRWINPEPGVEWMVVMCCLLFYAWLSMTLGFFSENYWRFLLATLICYVVLVIVLFSLTAYLSGTSLFDFYAYNQFFKACNLFYIVGLFMALVLRSVATFLESQ